MRYRVLAEITSQLDIFHATKGACVEIYHQLVASRATKVIFVEVYYQLIPVMPQK
jgi:hypothetical protein